MATTRATENSKTSSRVHRRSMVVVVLVALAALVAACGPSGRVVDEGAVATPVTPETQPTGPSTTNTPADPEASPVATGGTPDATPATTETPQPTSEPTPATPRTISVYYLRPAPSENIADPFIVAVARQVDPAAPVGRAALEALVAGPTADETALGVASNIPAGTLVLDLDIDDGIATVDLSGDYDAGGGTLSMTARLAEVVFTLTQFPTVDAVQFRIEGEDISVFSSEGIVIDAPLAREDFRDLMPAIFVDSPAVGEAVQLPVRIRGEAAVFEAVFLAQLRTPIGEPIGEPQVVMTDNGTGWGRFDATLIAPPEAAGNDLVVHVWASSAEDGRDIDIVDVPIHVER